MDTVLIRKQRLITYTEEFEIRELAEPTKNGSTHAAFDILGTPVLLLRKDIEGDWVVDVNASNGAVDAFLSDVPGLAGEGNG